MITAPKWRRAAAFSLAAASVITTSASAQSPIMGVVCHSAELPAGMAKKLGRDMIGPPAARIAEMLAPRAGLQDATGAFVFRSRSAVTVLWVLPGRVCPMVLPADAWGRAERAVMGVEG